jgi:cytochrome c oxidase assembly factor CtaG
MSAAAVKRRTLCFGVGLLAVAAALSPPLEAAAGRRLSVHMVQHLVLVLVAAPFLVAGRPAVPVRLDGPGWRIVRRVGTNPIVVLTLAVGGFWAWHLPRLYDAALSNTAVHVVEHSTFIGGAFLFWMVVLDPGPRRRLGLGATCGFVFAAMLTNIWLAAGLTFSSTPLYSGYLGSGAAAALSDQQLAGVIMWLPADIVYFVTLLALFRRLLVDVELRMLGAGR